MDREDYHALNTLAGTIKNLKDLQELVIYRSYISYLLSATFAHREVTICFTCTVRAPGTKLSFPRSLVLRALRACIVTVLKDFKLGASRVWENIESYESKSLVQSFTYFASFDPLSIKSKLL